MKTLAVMLLTGMMLTMNTHAELGTVLFEDRFEEELGEGWAWLRENAEDWRITDKGLEIRPRPGDANSVNNALVRTLPDDEVGDIIIEVTVTFSTDLTQQYEQAGITWYADDKPVFKLVHERIDGDYYIIPGKVPADSMTVHLRLVVIQGKYTAEFRNEGENKWNVSATGDLETGKKNQISLQTYHGPEEGDHWMRFSNFKITKPAAVGSQLRTRN